MPKKRVVKERAAKAPKSSTSDSVVKLLIENFVGIQKTFLDLNEKLGSLTTHIEELLRLFEISAKNIAEKPELGFEKEFTDKLNLLLEQNKLLARGITLISGATMPAPQPTFATMAPRPMQMPMQGPMPEKSMAEPSEEYTQSGYSSTAIPKPKQLPQA